MVGESEAFVKSKLDVVLNLNGDLSLDEGFSLHRLSWSQL
jgi:hypothetical protein